MVYTAHRLPCKTLHFPKHKFPVHTTRNVQIHLHEINCGIDCLSGWSNLRYSSSPATSCHLRGGGGGGGGGGGQDRMERCYIHGTNLAPEFLHPSSP